MVDTVALNEKIKESGKSKAFLAKKIGCTVQSFRLKRNNITDFRSSEVDNLCTELGITKLTEKEKIFFKK